MKTPTREQLIAVGQAYKVVEMLHDCFLKAAKRPRLTQAMTGAEQSVRLGQWQLDLATVKADLEAGRKVLADALADLRKEEGGK